MKALILSATMNAEQIIRCSNEYFKDSSLLCACPIIALLCMSLLCSQNSVVLSTDD